MKHQVIGRWVSAPRQGSIEYWHIECLVCDWHATTWPTRDDQGNLVTLTHAEVERLAEEHSQVELSR